MKHFLISRLSRLDVKWTNVFHGALDKLTDIHSNPYYELIMVTQGPIYLAVGGEKLTLHTGESLLLTPWDEHAGWKDVESQSGFFWVQFLSDPPLREETWTEPSEARHFLHKERSHLRIESDDSIDYLLIPRRFISDRRYELFRCFEKLYDEFQHPVGNYRFRLTMLLCQILENLSSDVLDKYELSQPLSTAYLVYRNLVNKLDEHYIEELSMQQIGELVDRKYEYLSLIFKKYSGITIMQYIQRLRIQKAKHLLLTGGKSNREIAAEVGFQDPLYFSRLFKKIEGLSPSEFKSSCNSKN